MIEALPDLLLPYLVGIASSVLLVVATIVAYAASERRAVAYLKREARLPEAARWHDLSARVKDLEGERDALQDELLRAKEMIQVADRKRLWIEQIEEDIRQKEHEEAELRRVQADYAQASEQLAQTREETARLNGEKAKVEFEREGLRDDSARLEQRIEEQKADLTRVDDRVQELRSREEEIRHTLLGLRSEVESTRVEVNELTSRRDTLESEISRLRKELESLNADQYHLQESLQHEAELKASIQGLERRLEHEQDHLAAIREKTGARDPASADTKQVLQELWLPVTKTTEFGNTDQVTSGRKEGDALDSVRQYLQDQGLLFSDRVVNAFHTSLKCADDTPLLVLAGISGTGKSLLPRRYAEAMGIHFLHTPVQPRWDGPQDLLGFYNYLENRYKATPLLRALLQHDQFFRTWKPQEFVDASEHLLVVLLDEMNLARVEYYFSEFLSRLEMRRDLNRDDPNDVRKAELPIEVGRLASIEDNDPVRVFVDSNVLFVGTINEDESTLSMSDKVVDRANIMRFGRPQDLTNVPHASAGISEHRAQQPLAKSDWNEWTSAGRIHNPEREHEALIGKLNEALEQVGRPFGYRTRRAILTYISMYPEQNEAGRRHALADQIEQRILPKLRGVDVNEQFGSRAIAEVKEVIKEVDDAPLHDAVERGADGGDLFVWSGVDRSTE